MKREYIKAYNELKKMGVPVFVRDDMKQHGNFHISAEESNSSEWVSYYDGHYIPGWDCGVHPAIDSTLAKYGLHCEWQNPGELSVWN